MGAALSSAYSSFVSVVESFCQESYNWISCFSGGMMSDKENGISTSASGGDEENVVVRSRGMNFNLDEEEVVVKSRGLGFGKEEPSLGDVWNESNVAEAYQNGAIRSIVPTEKSPSEPLQVTFTNDSTSSELILCWISPDGDLHHYYRLAPNGGSHLEHTKTGDAFVIFTPPAPADSSSDATQGDEEEGWEPVCNHENVVAAYRPKSAAEGSHQYVAIGQTESIVTSAGGFLRGSVKKQKVAQWTITVSPEKPKAPKPADAPEEDTRNKFYEKRKYGDWTVYCEPGCWDPSVADSNSKGEAKEGSLSKHEVFQADLKGLSDRLPEHVREVLSDSTVLYMNTTHSVAQKVDNPVGCFHPGRDWLEQHKMNPDKCGQVEFYNVSNYADHRKLWGTGGIILHEFCHAYHNKHLPDGYENQDIIDCYNAAMEEGLYDNCNYHACYVGGRKDYFPFGDDNNNNNEQTQCEPKYEIKTNKHYACTNPMEYFAELSVAFLASPDDDLPQEEYNKWYPHNAKQLKEHDPRAFELLQKLWGVEKQ